MRAMSPSQLLALLALCLSCSTGLAVVSYSQKAGDMPGSDCPDGRAILNAHNLYRSYYGVPPMVWDKALAAKAQKLAYTTATGSAKCLKLVEDGPGENMAAFYTPGTPKYSCKAAADKWYSQFKYYQYTSTPMSTNWNGRNDIGHFSQVVWKSSTKLGCGMAKGKTSWGDACYTVVCHYEQWGNLLTNQAFSENIPKRKSFAPSG